MARESEIEEGILFDAETKKQVCKNNTDAKLFLSPGLRSRTRMGLRFPSNQGDKLPPSGLKFCRVISAELLPWVYM